MPPSEATPPSFEQALDDLTRILRNLEDGSLSLDDSLAHYERGIGLLRQCYAQLRSAEQKVKLLSGVGEDGSPEMRNFEHAASMDSPRGTGRRTPRPANGADAGINE